jgi:hypothetical protein
MTSDRDVVERTIEVLLEESPTGLFPQSSRHFICVGTHTLLFVTGEASVVAFADLGGGGISQLFNQPFEADECSDEGSVGYDNP